MIKLWMCVVPGEDYSRIAIANRDMDKMDGQEMDDECVFVDTFNGRPIPLDFPDGALNHTRNTFTKVGIVVIVQ